MIWMSCGHRVIQFPKLSGGVLPEYLFGDVVQPYKFKCDKWNTVHGKKNIKVQSAVSTDIL
jgi:hypothetical protein